MEGSSRNMENQTFVAETADLKGNGSYYLERGSAELLPQSQVMEITSKIGLYSVLIVSPIGVLLNILALIVFIKIKNYKTSTGILLICIAIADICVLIGMIVTRAFVFESSFDIFNSYTVKFILCKGGPFIYYTGLVWSGLLLTSVTIERFLSITFVLKVKTWNLLKFSKCLSGLYLTLSLILGAGQAYGIIIFDEKSTTLCGYNPADGTVGTIDTIVNTVVMNGICSGLIFIFTVLIAIKIHQSKRERSTLNDNNSNHVPGRKEIKITFMIFIVATVFILTRFPTFILYEMTKYYFSREMYFNKHYLNSIAVSPISYAIIVINHSINFLIYMCFLKKFREGFKQCCSRKYNIRNDRESIETLSSNVSL